MTHANSVVRQLLRVIRSVLYCIEECIVTDSKWFLLWYFLSMRYNAWRNIFSVWPFSKTARKTSNNLEEKLFQWIRLSRRCSVNCKTERSHSDSKENVLEVSKELQLLCDLYVRLLREAKEQESEQIADNPRKPVIFSNWNCQSSLWGRRTFCCFSHCFFSLPREKGFVLKKSKSTVNDGSCKNSWYKTLHDFRKRCIILNFYFKTFHLLKKI